MKAKLKNISLVFILSILFISCNKKNTQTDTKMLQVNPEKHSWYYFADGNFHKSENLNSIPSAAFKPWTEAVRISSASVQDSNNEKTPKGFALVNRIGVLSFENDKINLVRDTEFFFNSTADNLVFYNNTPVFSVYKNSFFNDQKFSRNAIHTFLVQFNPEQNVCYPVLTVENLKLPSTAEITDFIWDGQYWTCSVKDTKEAGEKIEFSYLTFQTKEAVTTIYPTTAGNSLHINETNAESFRKAKETENFEKAPLRIKNLLTSLPENLCYSVKVSTAGGHSPRTYIQRAKSTDETDLEAQAILSDSWAACLFSDGSLFLNGALFGNRILKHGNNIAIRLPKLPSGFSYGSFVISGTSLYAAWEESSFFSTARSGFISVDLNEVLYKNEFRY